MSKDESGRAFPKMHYEGMTLRQYYAGQALPVAMMRLKGEGNPKNAVEMAVSYADALIERLK